MPTLKIIDGTKVDVYSREHPPPHFHAIHSEDEELIVIQTLETYAGGLPRKKRKKIIDWAEENQEFLLENFKRLNPHLL